MRYHFMPNRIARIKKSDNNKCWQGFREIRTLINWWQQCKNGTATLENSLTVPQKLKCGVTLYSALPLLGVYPRGMKTCAYEKLNINIQSIIHSSQKGKKKPRCPSADEWLNKIWYSYAMECYSAIKRNQMLIHVTT